MSIGVLLADDQSMVRAGFRMILEAQPDIAVIGEAANGREAIEQSRLRKPDEIDTSFFALTMMPQPQVPLSHGSVSVDTVPHGIKMPHMSGGISPSAERKCRP